MKEIYFTISLFFIFLTTLFAQADELCEGRYKSILHDSTSGINQQELSRLDADEKGNNLTLKEDKNQITITQNGKKEFYIKDEKIDYKYLHQSDKTKYLLKPKKKYHDLYMYGKELLITYDCTFNSEKNYNLHEEKAKEAYTTFSKYIKRAQSFLFKDEGFTVELFDLEVKKEYEREVVITFVEEKDYSLSLWCYKDKEEYLDALTVEEEDFEYYVCSDPGGRVEIKINAQGFYFQPEYMTLEKEIVVNGEPDIDIMPMSGSDKFMRGTLVK